MQKWRAIHPLNGLKASWPRAHNARRSQGFQIHDCGGHSAECLPSRLAAERFASVGHCRPGDNIFGRLAPVRFAGRACGDDTSNRKKHLGRFAPPQTACVSPPLTSRREMHGELAREYALEMRSLKSVNQQRVQSRNRADNVSELRRGAEPCNRQRKAQIGIRPGD